MQGSLKKALGVLLIAVGLIALVTPFTPGSWLIFVGAEILGIELIFAKRTTAFIRRHQDTLIPGFCIIAPFIAATVGSFFTVGAIPTWYATLVKPSWNPPSFVFGPVWTTLYLLMGVAALLVWRTGKADREFALKVFFAHLSINALWSVVFFGAHATTAAFGIIILLWGLIVWLIYLFSRISRVAGWLLVPYLLWVTYASTLNLGIVYLN